MEGISKVKTIDEHLLIPVLEKGDKLYHYTSAAGFHGICNGEFWVTESGFLNDFTEFNIATGIFCEVMDKHVLNKKKCEAIKMRVLDEIEKSKRCPEIGGSVAYGGDYVISFSLDYDSTLMWSEYSDFLGYCLKFDFEKLFNSFDKKASMQHGQVIYNHEQQISLIEQTIEKEFINDKKCYDYLNSWNDFNLLPDDGVDDLYLFLSIFIDMYNQFFKLPCFEGEHEYRFIFYCGHDGGRFKKDQLEKQHFRVKDEVLIPYIKKKLSSLDSLEEVLIGPKNKSDIATLGAEKFLRNLKLDVPVTKSHMPLRY